MNDVSRHPSAPRKSAPPPKREEDPVVFCTTCLSIRPVAFAIVGTEAVPTCRACGRASVIDPNLPAARKAHGDEWQATLDAGRAEARHLALNRPPPPKPAPMSTGNKVAGVLLVLIAIGVAGFVWWCIRELFP